MMTKEEARQFAASAWCIDANRNTVMDVNLAEAFADILQQRVNDALVSAEFVNARQTMSRIFCEDEAFMIGYVSNIAMLLHDRYGITEHDRRNKAAKEIMQLVFDLKSKR